MLQCRFTAITIDRLSKSEQGFLLVAALTLLSALTLLGTTAYLLSSTDIKIGGNFRNNQMALHVAMAGAERARQAFRLENMSSSDAGSFSDELNNTTHANGKVLLTSVATGPSSAKARVEIIVEVNTAVASSPAVVYSKGDVTGNGSSLTINGSDACSQETALGPIYTKDPATTTLNGNPTLSGSPSTPQHGTLDIDIQSLIDSLRPSTTTTLIEDKSNTTYGSTSNYVTVYSDTSDPVNDQGLKLQNVTGYGILLVKGDLVLGGGFTWNGLIYATGSVTLNGGGGAGINVYGQIYAGTSSVTDVTINGGNTLGYDSCKIKKALASQAFKVVSWKHDY